ncbi:hypothetical protein ACS0TY_012688 [Phlomoides rotata]
MRHVLFAKVLIQLLFMLRIPVFIPCITLEAPHDSFSFIPFKRKQFTIRLCYAMTINKAQGQILDFVGVYLKEPVFSYVLIRPSIPSVQDTNYTKNIVYHDVLNAANGKLDITLYLWMRTNMNCLYPGLGGLINCHVSEHMVSSSNHLGDRGLELDLGGQQAEVDGRPMWC